MIVDSSAVVAVIREEPDAAALSETMLRAERLRMSAATYLETSIVVDARRDPVAVRVVDTILGRFGAEIEPFTDEPLLFKGDGFGHPDIRSALD